MTRTLGTQLRHLLDLLDGAVENSYLECGLTFRPRYTPVVRALMKTSSLSIGEIASAAGITQPAATQTVNLMRREKIVSVRASRADGRTKAVSLTPQARSMIPRLEMCWQCTALAAKSLDSDLGYVLSTVLEQAIEILHRRSYGERIREARSQMEAKAQQ